MKSCIQNHRFFSQQGASLLELALIVSFFFLFIGATVEMVSYLKTSFLANSIAREVATVAFRDCTLRAYGDSVDMSAVQACLDGKLNPLQAQYESVLNGVQIAGVLYRYDAISDSVQGPLISPQLAGFSPKVSAESFADSRRRNLLVDQKIIVYGEVSYIWHPIIPGIWLFLGGGQKEIHAISAV